MSGLSPEMIDAMLAAGLTAEQMGAVIKAHLAAHLPQGPRCVPSEMREAVLIRDNYTCAYCGSRLAPLHCDHVIPYSRGGRTVMENLVTACQSCNCAKRDRTPDEWRRS